MHNLKDLFEYIGKRKFLQNYTDIPSENGIQGRLNGKGTSPKSKKTQPTPEELSKIKAGLQKMVKDMNKVIEKI